MQKHYKPTIIDNKRKKVQKMDLIMIKWVLGDTQSKQ